MASVVVGGEVVEAGEFDFDLKPLTAAMQAMVKLAGLPLSTPPAISDEWAERVRLGAVPKDAPSWVRHYRYDPKKKAVVLRPGYVWHTPVRLAPGDPTLTDEQWETVAERLMKATRIHQAGCRWIAVRHADDHIHLMATLVSEVTAKPFHPYRDFLALRRECRAIERDLGLVVTADVDKTAVRQPSRKEKGKADREGRAITPREELQRVVARAAAEARDGQEFLGSLERAGVAPQVVRDGRGMVLGYSVALPDDLTRQGKQVRYSGSKLAADLSWPKLQNRWAELSGGGLRPAGTWLAPAEREAVLEEAVRVVQLATKRVQVNRLTGGQSQAVDGIVHATGELLVVLAQGWDGRAGAALVEIGAGYDRAARTPHLVVPERRGNLGFQLRQAAREVAGVGMLSRVDARTRAGFLVVTLVLALVSLLVEISEWQKARGRVHQGEAAAVAAGRLSALSGPRPVKEAAAVSRRPGRTLEQPPRRLVPVVESRGRGR
ncbi:relaxase/mobilization nuclease domain-containing protein [Actinosynnema sp. NPDC023587]|uniref:relaxase/mobilization nuclease domain-containing protein n=1 Tax=Actinosynnema sp. NPDC023587 TaxID=3154695 RepID=UPI0033CFBD56